MKILSIETSCDETAIAIVDAESPSTSLVVYPERSRGVNNEHDARFSVLGNALISQTSVHEEFGGVFPMLAKREHAKNLVPLLEAALEEAEFLHEDTQVISDEMRGSLATLLAREPGLEEAFVDFISECEPPALDAIAVTSGPGLEPALWVGVNFAKALALVWGLPIVAVNHLEGHLLSALVRPSGAGEAEGEALEIRDAAMPVLGLLISGGHTELVLMKEWLAYERIGQTRDDAVGEAFDKVARMLGLPYPGGPEVSKLSEQARTANALTSEAGRGVSNFTLPRPMLHDDSYDFSFSGLKTAVLYLLKAREKTDADGHARGGLTEREKTEIAREFEDAVAEVLWKKTERALENTNAQTLVLGGGVSANAHIRRIFKEKVAADFPHVALSIPAAALTTDNAVMIGIAGYYRALRKEFIDANVLRANGHLSLA